MRPVARLLACVAVLLGTGSTWLDCLSQPSDWAVVGGALALLALAAGIAASLYQLGRCLLPFFTSFAASYD